MLAKYSVLSSTYFPQSGGNAFPLTAGDDYIFQTDKIIRAKLYSTDDSEFLYLFGDADRGAHATIRISDTLATIVTDSEKTQDNKHIALSVIVDEKGQTVASTWYVNQDHIFLAYTYKTGYTRVWINNGGSSYQTISVSETLAEIVALAEA